MEAGRPNSAVRVVLPAHLRDLARTEAEVVVDVAAPVTQRTILNAVEARFPMLRGTMRDHRSQQRRAYVRFFACMEDLSHESPDALVPSEVATGREPYLVIAALSGG